jgi:hypothetical protein
MTDRFLRYEIEINVSRRNPKDAVDRRTTRPAEADRTIPNYGLRQANAAGLSAGGAVNVKRG